MKETKPMAKPKNTGSKDLGHKIVKGATKKAPLGNITAGRHGSEKDVVDAPTVGKVKNQSKHPKLGADANKGSSKWQLPTMKKQFKAPKK